MHVPLLRVFIGCFDCKFGAEDVGKFGAITIPSADDFLFVVVVVTRRQKMSENQLGNIDFLFLQTVRLSRKGAFRKAGFNLVNFNGNSAAVVENCDGTVFAIDRDFDVVHVWVADFVVCCVDEDFIKDLVETRNDSDVPKTSAESSNETCLKTITPFSES